MCVTVRVLLVFLLMFVPPLAAGEAAPPGEAAKLFADAGVAYAAGDWAKAIEKYEAIPAASGGVVSAALCHNLANAHFRAGDEAKAALWNRRGLALAFWVPETRQNLRFLGNKLGFLSFERGWAERLPRRWVELAVAGAGWVAGLAVLWLVWWTPAVGRRWVPVTLLALAVPVVAAGVTALVLKQRAMAPVGECMVVVAKDAAAFTAPVEASPTVISLPPGSEVRPLRTEGLWTYAAIPSASDEPLRGWVRTAVLEKLWPWAPALVD